MKKNLFSNEKGVALIVALLLLLVVTLIGVNSISTTTFEVSISGNERVGTDAFYAAEAGTQVAVNQIPTTTAIPRTQMGDTSSYRAQIQSLGIHHRPGFDLTWEFRRYQINSVGESLRTNREIEIQVSYGPFTTGTQYNN